MKSHSLIALALLFIVLLSACSSSLVESETLEGQRSASDLVAEPAVREAVLSPTESVQSSETNVKGVGEAFGNQVQALWPDGEVQLDEQGYVEVAITPLNLNAPDGTLNFSVGLNTHSVDLSMDLASAATLEADNGLGVEAVTWDAPSGGHHVSGVLSFPALVDGEKLLEGASHLTLKIHDVDAAERSFTWSLSG